MENCVITRLCVLLVMLGFSTSSWAQLARNNDLSVSPAYADNQINLGTVLASQRAVIGSTTNWYDVNSVYYKNPFTYSTPYLFTSNISVQVTSAQAITTTTNESLSQPNQYKTAYWANLDATGTNQVVATNTPLSSVIFYKTSAMLDWTVYSTPISIIESTTIIFKGTYPGYADVYATNVYIKDLGIYLSPGSGNFSNAITETVVFPGVSTNLGFESLNIGNTAVEYSINNGSWLPYTAPFTVNGNSNSVESYQIGQQPYKTAVVRIKYTSGSSTVTNTYWPGFYIADLVTTPSVNGSWVGNYTSPNTITATTATSDAIIYYSRFSDALHTSSTYPDSYATNTYTNPLVITDRAYLRMEARKANYNAFRPAGLGVGGTKWYSTYSMLTPLSPLTMQPNGGTFSNLVVVTVTQNDAYTPLNVYAFGLSKPGRSSQATAAWQRNANGSIQQQFPLTESGNYTATMYTGAFGETNAPTSSTFTFIVNELVTTPDSIKDGPFTVTATSQLISEKNLFFNVLNPLHIYATTDGSLPTTNSTALSFSATAPASIYITNTNTTTVIWMATRANWNTQYVTNHYRVVDAITASPAPATYAHAIDITLSNQNNNSIIFTLNGTDWVNYTNPIHLDGYGQGNLTLIAAQPNVLTNSFNYTFKANSPTIVPDSTNFLGSVTITATPSTIGDPITYAQSVVGSTTDPNTHYTNALTITRSAAFSFQESRTGYQSSDIVRVSYTGLQKTTLVVTNTSNLSMYPSAQMGVPWWEIYASNSITAQTTNFYYGYTQPRQTASITLYNNDYDNYFIVISTNSGSLFVPLTKVTDTDAERIFTATYSGLGNEKLTSYQNSQVNIATAGGNGGNGILMAQNPEQQWLFGYTNLQADYQTARSFVDSLWFDQFRDYLIVINGNKSSPKDLIMQLRSLPNNDEFTNAPAWEPLVATSSSVTTQAYNIYASATATEPLLLSGNTVWYKIRPLQGGTFTAQVDAFNDYMYYLQATLKKDDFKLHNTAMTIWEGTNQNELTLKADSKVSNASTNVNPYTFPNLVSCRMQASNTYYLRIDASELPGEYTIKKTYVASALNDNFVNAELLTANIQTYDNGARYQYIKLGANFGATTEPNEPMSHNRSVWYKIITPNAGYLELAIVTETNNSVAVLPYYIGDNVAVVITNLNVYTPATYIAAGTPIYIAVNGDECEFKLSATLTLPPNNDYFTNSTILTTSTPQITRFSVYNSYSYADETQDTTIPDANNSLWWKVQALQSGTFTVISPDYTSDYWKLFTEQGTEVTPIDELADRRTYVTTPGTYNYKLTTRDSSVGDGKLNCLLFADAINNDKTSPTPITTYAQKTYANGIVYTYSLTGINNVTTDVSEPFPHTVWYSWISPMSGFMQASVSSTLVSPQVFQDNQPADTTVAITAAESILLAVGGNIDLFTVALDVRKIPSNDNIENAIAMELDKDYDLYTKYGTIAQPSTNGVADLWFTYNPQNQPDINIYVSPTTNGTPISLEVSQDGQVIATHTYSQLNEDPLNTIFTNLSTVTLRLIVERPNTDCSISLHRQIRNDHFVNRDHIELHPVQQTVALDGDITTLTKYTAHVISNNKDASVEVGEPCFNFLQKDPGYLRGQSLWWEITTPVTGMFSIVAREGSDLLHIELTQSNSLPGSVEDFIAWNSTSIKQNKIANGQILAFKAQANQHYNIRVDTLVGGVGRIDFDVSQISPPAGDDIRVPSNFSHNGYTRTYYYKDYFPYQVNESHYDMKSTLYGATRQELNGYLEDRVKLELSSPNKTRDWAYGLLPYYPAWQTVWYKITPDTTGHYTVNVNANFSPVLLYSEISPLVSVVYNRVTHGSDMYLTKNHTYYFLVDALVTPDATYSGNPRLFRRTVFQSCDDPIIYGDFAQGLNTDVNRSCEHMLPAVIDIKLKPNDLPANDSILQPTELALEAGYLTSSCENPYGDFFVRYAQNNTNATKETSDYIEEDWMNGAGKTLWWKVTSKQSGPMIIDTTASEVPVKIKVFTYGDLNSGYVLEGGYVTIQVKANTPYLIGMDSATNTSGWLAFSMSQVANKPLNDNLVNAYKITEPITCGILNSSSIEQYESSAGSGSVWYKIVNYGDTPKHFTFNLESTNAFMDLYISASSTMQSLLPQSVNTNSISYITQSNTIAYVRVFGTNQPVSGTFSLHTTVEDAFYQEQVFITPSTSFLSSLIIRASSSMAVAPKIYYSQQETTTNSTIYSGPIVITDSTVLDFLVVIPGIQPYHVINTYTKLPDITITESCVFSNSMLITTGPKPAGTTIAYRRGTADGAKPVQQNWELFPDEGMTITTSAIFDFIVTAPNATYTQASRHYTNTVAAPNITVEGPLLLVQSATPEATLQVKQAGLYINYPTNSVVIVALAPIIQITATRPGWIPSQIDYKFTPTFTNISPIVIFTNALSVNHLNVTLVNPNPGTVIWYTISNNISSVSTSAVNSVTLDLDYTCQVEMYAGSVQLSFTGPKRYLDFTAQLRMPALSQEGSTLVINNPNQIQSSIVVNGVNLGQIATFRIPIISGILDTAYAISDYAEPSPTNSFIPQYSSTIAVTPASTSFNTELPVNLSVMDGSLTVTIKQEGAEPQTYNNVGKQYTITLDKSTTIEAYSQLYGRTIATATNAYVAQVGPVQCAMPGFIDLDQTIYNAASPVILSDITPNVTYSYRTDNNDTWIELPNNKLRLLPKSTKYYIQANREGWHPSQIVEQTWNASLDHRALINFVNDYYTMFPGNPTTAIQIVATNSALVDMYPYSYKHFVWMEGTGQSESLYLSTTGTFKIYHKVVKFFEQSSTVFLPVEYGPTNSTSIKIVNFDWRVVAETYSADENGLVVSSDASIYEHVYFYRPTWIQSWTNMQLLAISDAAIYNMEPLRSKSDPSKFLIPGNLYEKNDRVQFIYKYGSERGSFTMKFRTLTPIQYRSVADNKVAVLLSSDYQDKDVGVYYATNNNPNFKQPFDMVFPMSGLFGSLPLQTIMSSTNRWILNSKYQLNNLTNYISSGLPALPIYGN